MDLPMTLRLLALILGVIHILYMSYERLCLPSCFCSNQSCRKHISYWEWQRYSGTCRHCCPSLTYLNN